MHTHAEAHQIENQYQIAVGMRQMRPFGPQQSKIDGEGGQEERESVDLGLHSRKPHRVAPGHGQGGTEARGNAHNGQMQRHALALELLLVGQSLKEQTHSEIDEQRRQRREQAAKSIDHQGDIRGVGGEIYGHASRQHPHRIAGRVAHLQTLSHK